VKNGNSTASKHVLDASAVIAWVDRESGYEGIAPFMSDAAICSVNLAEVISKMLTRGLSAEDARQHLDLLQLEIIDFDEILAYETGGLCPTTRHVGLSLGDRACLATAQSLGVPAVTTDRSWASLGFSIPIHVIR